MGCIDTSEKTKEEKKSESPLPKELEETEDVSYFPEVAKDIPVLDSLFDLGLFYFKQGGSKYFVIVEGEFEEPEYYYFNPKRSFKVGIVNQDYQSILAAEYDKISNPGVFGEEWIEVEKDGKFGLFNFQKNILIPVEYDAIYPSDNSSYWLKVRKGNVFGILNVNENDEWAVKYEKEGENIAQVGFASPYAEESYKQWQFDMKSTKWQAFYQLHAPYLEEEALEARSVVIAPSYMSESGMLPEYMPSLMLKDVLDYEFGYTEFGAKVLAGKKSNSWIHTVIEWFYRSANARGEMIHQDKLVVMDRNGKKKGEKTLFEGEMEYGICREKNIRYVDSNVIEVRVEGDHMHHPIYDERPVYTYFRVMENGEIKQLESHRTYPFSQFVHMNSSYFDGCFYTRLHDSAYEWPGKGIHTSHYNKLELTRMLMEIYADNQLHVPLKNWQDTFARNDWYQPKFVAADSLLPMRDLINVALIKKRILHLSENEEKFTKPSKIIGPYAP